MMTTPRWRNAGFLVPQQLTF